MGDLGEYEYSQSGLLCGDEHGRFVPAPSSVDVLPKHAAGKEKLDRVSGVRYDSFTRCSKTNVCA